MIVKIRKSYLLAAFLFASFFGLQFAFAQVANSSQAKSQFCSISNRTLLRTDLGDDVRALQDILKEEGVYPYGSTGYYGIGTEGAVKALQSRWGIFPAGKFGPQTLARAKSIWCGGGVSPVYPSQQQVNIVPTNNGNGAVLITWTTITTGLDESRNIRSCNLNGETVQTNGSKSFNIQTETTFTVNCTDFGGRSYQKSVTVRPNQILGALPTMNLSISPSSPIVGQAATLYWTSSNATYCTSSASAGNLPTTGSQQITVSSLTQSYTITCFGQGGQSVSQTVKSGALPTTTLSATIVANPIGISLGQTSVLTWSSNLANRCTVNGVTDAGNSIAQNSIQQNTINGTMTVNPTQNTTYTLTCYDAYNRMTESRVAVYVGSSNTTNGLVTEISTIKNNYNIGDNFVLNIVVRNNTNSVITYRTPICSLSGPFDITIDGQDMYSFLENMGRTVCLAFGFNDVTLQPGQSKTYEYQATIANKNFSSLLKRLKVTWNANVNPNLNANNPETTFTINGGATGGMSANISANPVNVSSSGQPTTLTWTSVGANRCTVTAVTEVGNSSSLMVLNQNTLNGSMVVNPTQQTVYRIECFDSNGAITQSSARVGIGSMVLGGTLSASVSTSKSTYLEAERFETNITLRNNTNSSVTFREPICSSYGPFTVRIDNQDMYDFLDTFNRYICQAFGYNDVTITPGNSKTYTYTTTIARKSFSNVTRKLTVIWDTTHNPNVSVNNPETTFNINGSPSSNTITSFTGVNTSAGVNLNWSGIGANICSLYRYSSLGPTDGSYHIGSRILIANMLPVNQNYITPYVGTAANVPASSAFMQLTLECGTASQNITVRMNDSTTNQNTISSFTGLNTPTGVNLNWTGTGANMCTLYRYSSLGPSDTSFHLGSRVLIASSLSVSGTYSTPFITTAANIPASSAFMQLTLECGTAVQNISVRQNDTTTNTITVRENAVALGSQSISYNIAWASNYNSAQGVLLELVDVNNNFVGSITRVTNSSVSSPANGNYNWSVTPVITNHRTDAMSCLTVAGQQYCGGDPRILNSGNYKVRATYFTPSNACFGYCVQQTGQAILGTEYSPVFSLRVLGQ